VRALYVQEGSALSVTCNSVGGSPAPRLQWKRLAPLGPSERLAVAGPSERLAVAGPLLSWAAVSRQAAGRYACEADNGFGPVPVRQEVDVEVLCKYSLLYITEILVLYYAVSMYVRTLQFCHKESLTMN
jgi:hypothetical protein